MNKKIIIIRVLLWLTLAVFFGWLAYLKIAPSGKIGYAYDFSRPSFFIGKPAPTERVGISEFGAEIKGDPVYFSLRPPRRFEKARVTVVFKNTTDFPVVELGLLNDKVAWNYDLKPLQNKIIDQLALVWPAVDGQNGSRLIEREKKYDTVEKFLSSLPPNDEIALYNYSLKRNFLLEKYQPNKEKRLIDYKFRGSYQFYTYIKNEALDYVFNFDDLNINRDDDPVEIKVYSPDGLIRTERIADDPAAASERRAEFKISGLKEGFYRLSVVANDDIITKNILSGTSYFALINKVWLTDNQAKKIIIYTNSREINAQTINPASLGKIQAGENELDLKETYKQFSVKTASSTKAGVAGPKLYKIETLKDDLIISGDGVFSLSEDSLLDPRSKSVDRNIDINREKINYILTNYDSPAEAGEWRTATVEFDLTKAYQENGKYQFIISIPGLKAEEPAQGDLIIKEIKVDLEGTSLKKKLNKYLSR